MVSHFVSHHLTVSKVNAYNSIGYTLNEQENGAAEKLLLRHRSTTDQSIPTKVDIPDLYPGDIIKLPGGNIEKAFINQYADSAIKEVTDKFYDIYEIKSECISYKNGGSNITNFENWLEYFLSEFNQFSIKRVQGPDAHFDKLLGKDFSIEIALQNGERLCKTIKFGQVLVSYNPSANKNCFVGEAAFTSILRGEALFEDLYTGYNAEWSRNPADVYNRDIVMMIVMFSYFYKNRLSHIAKEKFGSFQSL